jgi:DNA/RNA endonuclease YhcR with UshA esterase domain
MRALAFALLFVAPAAPSLAQTPTPATIAPAAAKDHIGEQVTVEGVVGEVHHAASGRTTFIDIGGRYPNNPFAAVIFESDAGKFANVDAFNGKTVDITGRIRLDRGAPEIILSDPGQVKIK